MRKATNGYGTLELEEVHSSVCEEDHPFVHRLLNMAPGEIRAIYLFHLTTRADQSEIEGALGLLASQSPSIFFEYAGRGIFSIEEILNGPVKNTKGLLDSRLRRLEGMIVHSQLVCQRFRTYAPDYVREITFPLEPMDLESFLWYHQANCELCAAWAEKNNIDLPDIAVIRQDIHKGLCRLVA